MGRHSTDMFPTPDDLKSLSSSKPTYTIEQVMRTSPQAAFDFMTDPESARKTNPLISSVVVNSRDDDGDGIRVKFTVTDVLCGCVPLSFPATFWLPATPESGADPAATATAMAVAEAACSVRVVNRWTFQPGEHNGTALVRQDTYISAPALLRGF